MQAHTFIAESAAQAVEQIRQQLGPAAVVLNVRKLPGQGVARLWQKPRIEVLAFVPEAPAPTPVPAEGLAELRQELAQIKEQFQQQKTSGMMALEPVPVVDASAAALDLDARPGLAPHLFPAANTPPANRTEPCPTLMSLLETSGLHRVHAQRILDELPDLGQTHRNAPLASQLRLVREALVRCWRSRPRTASNFHVFIGPAGSGKTTALCKWLAQAVLLEGRRARVWRLDGQVANTAESLSVFAEILGVGLERSQPGSPAVDPSEMVFVDLPGINWSDPAAVRELGDRLSSFPSAEVHLVLNAAYEGSLLLAQARAFSGLPVRDVILTHVEEEPRWGKLWNLILGTNFSIAYLSGGQNIPGDFAPADPERILARHFPKK